MKNKFPSKWECMNCTDHDIIFLRLKGMGGIRSFNFHMHKEDAKELIKDLQILSDNKDKNVKLRITHDRK